MCIQVEIDTRACVKKITLTNLFRHEKRWLLALSNTMALARKSLLAGRRYVTRRRPSHHENTVDGDVEPLVVICRGGELVLLNVVCVKMKSATDGHVRIASSGWHGEVLTHEMAHVVLVADIRLGPIHKIDKMRERRELRLCHGVGIVALLLCHFLGLDPAFEPVPRHREALRSHGEHGTTALARSGIRERGQGRKETGCR